MPAPKRRSYSGPLGFTEDGYHVDDDGERVITEDGGKTWVYAQEGDPSHFERYHERYAVVDSTANRLAELAYEHGEAEATELIAQEQPHHVEVTENEPRQLGLEEAATRTAHTDAWKEN